MMGGDITYSSTPGKGTVFSLFISSGIKLKDQETIEDIKLYQDNTSLNQFIGAKFKGKILVAEDNPSNQLLIRLLLEKLGIEVTMANNGKEALLLAEKNEYQMILMDMQMPEMNGSEATRAIRQKEIKTPIFALTANAMKGDKDKCFEAGCDGYLSKPIIKEELLKTLNECLEVIS